MQWWVWALVGVGVWAALATAVAVLVGRMLEKVRRAPTVYPGGVPVKRVEDLPEFVWPEFVWEFMWPEYRAGSCHCRVPWGVRSRTEMVPWEHHEACPCFRPRSRS